ncbi:hypothetical protein IAR55_006489 [Kwoniella newhampshirensis]|uniref:Uncharacterized protein n=1 Tax=Kwoniella newhampshirensis TaxID=1651941 RepID=A0AAW0YX25_9TREE
MRARPLTPNRHLPVLNPDTPQGSRMIKDIDRKVCRGEIKPKRVFFKVAKAYEKVTAEKALLEKDIEKRKAAKELDKAACGSNKRTRFPQGELFDQEHRETHKEELKERKRAETEAREKKRAEARRRKKRQPSPLQE